MIIFQPLTIHGVASDGPGVFVGLITHFEIGLIKSPRPYLYVCMYVCRCLLLCTVLFLDFLPASSFIRVYFAGVSSDRFKLSILLILILNNPQSIRKIKIAAGRRGRGYPGGRWLQWCRRLPPSSWLRGTPCGRRRGSCPRRGTLNNKVILTGGCWHCVEVVFVIFTQEASPPSPVNTSPPSTGLTPPPWPGGR